MSTDQYKKLLLAALDEIKAYKYEAQKLRRENESLERQVKFLKNELEKR